MLDPGRPQVARALEDLPEEVRQEAAEIAGTGPGLSFRRRVEDAHSAPRAGWRW
jgi:hypothetical protein